VLRLRCELNIHGKMHVFGGSWGSTLALAYAIAHPETVQTLILRGVFLCRRTDVDYFFQGNAADFSTVGADALRGGMAALLLWRRRSAIVFLVRRNGKFSWLRSARY
jgi:pimeloyl-ACP methyl ester carboxylesterase